MSTTIETNILTHVADPIFFQIKALALLFLYHPYVFSSSHSYLLLHALENPNCYVILHFSNPRHLWPTSSSSKHLKVPSFTFLM